MSDTSLSVRALRSGDYDDWLRLYQGYAEFYGVTLTEDGISTLWAWLHAEHHPCRGFVAEGEENLQGLVHFRPIPSPLRGSNIGFVDDLYVDPVSRGQGVGKTLINAVIEEAEVNNWTVIRWITADNNYSARALYDQVATKTAWNTYEVKPEKA